MNKTIWDIITPTLTPHQLKWLESAPRMEYPFNREKKPELKPYYDKRQIFAPRQAGMTSYFIIEALAQALHKKQPQLYVCPSQNHINYAVHQLLYFAHKFQIEVPRPKRHGSSQCFDFGNSAMLVFLLAQNINDTQLALDTKHRSCSFYHDVYHINEVEKPQKNETTTTVFTALPLPTDILFLASKKQLKQGFSNDKWFTHVTTINEVEDIPLDKKKLKNTICQTKGEIEYQKAFEGFPPE